jgi:hypothetical protein
MTMQNEIKELFSKKMCAKGCGKKRKKEKGGREKKETRGAYEGKSGGFKFGRF